MFSKEIDYILKKFLVFFNKWGITPNSITFFGLICGILAGYYLFVDLFMFRVLICLNLICDVFDGNLSRFLKVENYSGYLFDHLSDRVVQFVLMLKYYLVFGNLFVVIVLFILHNVLYFFCNKKLYYSRFIFSMFFVFGFYFWGMIVVGLITGYGLFKQIKWLCRN